MSAPSIAVKVCGLTTLADARHAWRAGADLLGFVMVPASPRYVDAARVASLVRSLRAEGCSALMVGVMAVGMGDARDAAVRCELDLVQLHGACTPSDLQAIGRPALVAQRVRGPIDWDALAALGAWGHVLDGYDPVRLGGTGASWDWRLAADRPAAVGRVIVAGGLTPDNVTEAVRAARPWGVDVSSGVETTPGRKDPARVARFIERTKGA